VVLSLQKQLQALVGWRDKSAVLFSGCCLLILPYKTTTAAAATATAAAAAAAAAVVGGGTAMTDAISTLQQEQQQQQQQQYVQPSAEEPLVLSSARAAGQLAASWQQLQDLQVSEGERCAVTAAALSLLPLPLSLLHHCHCCRYRCCPCSSRAVIAAVVAALLLPHIHKHKGFPSTNLSP
jgi:hypothetical protein